MERREHGQTIGQLEFALSGIDLVNCCSSSQVSVGKVAKTIGQLGRMEGRRSGMAQEMNDAPGCAFGQTKVPRVFGKLEKAHSNASKDP